MLVKRWLFVATFIGCGWVAVPAQAVREANIAPEEPHSHPEALSVTTEDQELQEQILKINDALEDLHRQMAQRKKVLQATTSDAEKTTLYVALDGLRKERDMLERLLHDLVEEAQATEWTVVDEALKRARAAERPQERAVQREENLRERQQ